jgi:hypothetical protein
MQFRIQFLEGSARVIGELHADARNSIGAIELVRDIDWPPRAFSMRVLDLDGREVQFQGEGRCRATVTARNFAHRVGWESEGSPDEAHNSLLPLSRDFFPCESKLAEVTAR